MLKKNIAKLLVFAMLLSMLPFTAAADTTTQVNPASGTADQADTGYLTELKAKVTANGTPTSDQNLTISKPSNTNDPYTASFDVTLSEGQTTVNLDVSYVTSPDSGVTVVGYASKDKPGDQGADGTSAENGKVAFSNVSEGNNTLWLVATKADGENKSLHYYKLTVNFTAAKTEYEIKVAESITNGSVQVKVDDKVATKAAAGATVTVEATPTEGYTLDTITVTQTDGGTAVNMATANTFVMPAANVTVTATFKTETSETKEELKSIEISPKALGLVLGRKNTGTLTAKLTHTYSTAPDVTWTSSDTAVATVDAKGLEVEVTAKAEGTAIITATCRGVTSTCTVTVSDEAILATGVTLSKTNLTLNVGEAQELVATVAPLETTNKTVKWESSDEKVATVKDGKVAGVGAGTATITVTTVDGSNKSATCTVTVRPEPTISLDKNALTVKMGETAGLTATVEHGSIKSWVSSDEAIIKVAGSGNTATITPVAANKSATITVTVTGEGGTKTTTCKVTVVEADARPAAPTISLSNSELKAIEGDKASLTATATAYTKIVWKSSDETVASVKSSEDGLSVAITAVKAGKVTITATATGEGGTANASCTLTVEAAKVEGTETKIEKTEVEIKTNQTATGEEKKAVEKAEESIKNTDTAIAENLGSVVKATATADTNSVTVNGEKVDTAGLKEKLKQKDTTITDENIRTIIVPKIDIEVKGAEVKDGKAVSLSFKVDAYVEVTVTTAQEGETVNSENSVTSASKPSLNELKEEMTITVNLPLPETFAMPKNPAVKHEKDNNGGTFWHRAYKAVRGNGVWFKNNRGFSTLTVTETPADKEAEYNGELYTSLSDAIKAAENNATIKLLKEITNPVTVSDAITFTLAYNDGVTLGSVEIKAGNGYVLTQKDNTYTISKERTSSGGGGGGGGSSKPAIKPGEKPETPSTTTPGGGVAGFTDVATSAWYADSVQYVVDKGLFGGVGNGRFAPNANMTRAMMWTVLARYKGVNTNTGSNWYEAARTWAIAQGISDGTMADGNVTREQFVTMLWRLSGEPAATNSATFTDAGKVSDYAKTAVAWAVSKGIVNGYNDGSFKPQGSATRAEVAKMLTVFCQDDEQSAATPTDSNGANLDEG